MKPFFVLLAVFLLEQSVMPFLYSQSGTGSAVATYSAGRRNIVVGGELGLSQNYHSGGFRYDDCDCPVFEQGDAWGFSIGAVAEFPIGSSSGFLARTSFESRPGNFLVRPYRATGQFGTPLTAEVTYMLVSVDLLYRQHIITIGNVVGLSLAAGPSLAHVLRGSDKRSAAGGDAVLVDDVIPGLNRTILALRGGVVADIPVTNNLWITPGLYYHYSLTDVTSNENWQITALDLRLALMIVP
jgi:hypothetical protein